MKKRPPSPETAAELAEIVEKPLADLPKPDKAGPVERAKLCRRVVGGYRRKDKTSGS